MGGAILEKAVERLFGEVAGFAWLFFILILLCHALGAQGFFGVIMAFILSWLFLLPSKLLDGYLFDPLYRPKGGFSLGLPDDDDRPKNEFSLVVERTFATTGDFVTLATENQKRAPQRRFPRFFTPRRKALDERRRKVANLLGKKIIAEHYPNFPLYKSCELILRPTEKWSQVNSWLQLSKVARAFILPLLLIAVIDFLNSNWTETLLSGVGAETYSSTESGTQGHSLIMTILRTISAWASIIEHYISKLTIAVLSNPFAALVTFVLALWVYLGARIHSMRALYKGASEAEWVHAPDLSRRPRRSAA